ncbi:unnamed protein product [Pleuronectes platessa]|uniref:Uncharacterized protein n=1 Tax=Pleuronectes platessa TaxID=8262 RepID=A0A9N7W129_PLEPL|nr:unnamed protein product [Pleuronectes platessa]
MVTPRASLTFPWKRGEEKQGEERRGNGKWTRYENQKKVGQVLTEEEGGRREKGKVVIRLRVFVNANQTNQFTNGERERAFTPVRVDTHTGHTGAPPPLTPLHSEMSMGTFT